MRILVVNDLYGRSSAAGVAVTTAEALAGLGLDVHFLAAVQQPGEARTFEAGRLRVRLAHVPPYPIRWRAYRSLNNPPAVRALRESAAAIRPDVIHFHNLHIHFSYAALKAARRAGASVMLTVHDVMPFCYQKMFCFLDEQLRPGDDVDYRAGFLRCLRCTRFRFNPFRNGIIRRRIARYTDRVVAVSGPMMAALARNGIAAQAVVPNGIDLEAWRPTGERGAAFRRRHGLENSRVVLYGGRLDFLKGGLHMIRALAAVRDDVPDVRLLVPGEGGGFRSEMIAQAETSGVQKALCFTGWLDGEALKGAYEAADVVVSPSLCFESFNLINLEGMAMGKPVISSFFGGPSEVVVDGETGYLVNPLDERALTEKTARILQDRDLAARMGRAARERVETHYDIRKTAAATRSLYEELISKIL